MQFKLYFQSFLTIVVAICCITTASGQTKKPDFLVRNKENAQPIAGATIQSSNRQFIAVSDSLGRFDLTPEVTDKNLSLVISVVGYKPVFITAKQLTDKRTIELDIDISMLEEVVVSNYSPLRKVQALQMGTETITSQEAKKLPAILGEVDIIKLLQLKPGVKSAGEGFAGYYVRGGGADQNLILIDNAPVYNPNHLLGLFSVFNVDAVRDVKLYKAAYPAKYSGRLSSVLDVSMRAGSMDTASISGGIGFLSSRLSVETPIRRGRSSIILSGRRTYFDLFTNLVNKLNAGDSSYDAIPRYFFSDLNLRTDFILNEDNDIWATAYWGADNFASPADEDFSTRFTWGNRTASINWKSNSIRNTEIISSLFYSNYRYQLRNEFDFNSLVIKSAINTVGVKVNATHTGFGPVKLETGIDGMLHKLNIGDFSSSSDLSAFEVGERASGNEFGTFVNAEFDNGKKIAFLGGLRISGFAYENKVSLNAEPRAAIRYNISPTSALKASYTRMYQYLHLASLSSAALPTDMWYPSTGRTKPQYADQLSVGWSKALKDNHYFLSFETYYKWMYNQVEFRDGAEVFGNPKLENDFVFGKGVAYGVEAYIEKKLGRTTGWFGYTWSWASRRFEDINFGEAFRPRYDRRHDFSMVFIHKINNKFSLSGNWIFGSGSWITVPVGRYVFQDMVGDRPERITPIYSRRSNYQLAPVHRLDVSLVMALKSRRGNQDLTFSLYNAYSRRNPFYIQFREIDDANGFATGIEPTLVSLFPVLPGVTYNFKF